MNSQSDPLFNTVLEALKPISSHSHEHWTDILIQLQSIKKEIEPQIPDAMRCVELISLEYLPCSTNTISKNRNITQNLLDSSTIVLIIIGVARSQRALY
ncbi:hypothetical protein TNCV_1975321 [Trichonephila clavipes]|nr:hypothetical protein TNCV_1975321 [Trichonephila clavipes]